MTRKGFHRSNPERDLCGTRLYTGEGQLTFHRTSRNHRRWCWRLQALQSPEVVARKSPDQTVGNRPSANAECATNCFAIAVGLAFDEDVANRQQRVVDDRRLRDKRRCLVGQRGIPCTASSYAYL